MDTERIQVYKAMTELKETYEQSFSTTLTEEGAISLLRGASVYWHRRVVSVANPSRTLRRGENNTLPTTLEACRAVQESEGTKIMNERGSVNPNSAPGKWTPVPELNARGELFVRPVLTAWLELTFFHLLEKHGVYPFKWKDGEVNPIGRMSPRAGRSNGAVAGVVSDILVAGAIPQESTGYRMKSLSKRLGFRGTTVVASCAGYSVSRRTRKSSGMVGSMVLLSDLMQNMSRKVTWTNKRKRNGELYEERYGGKNSKNKPNRMNFPTGKDKIPNMESLETISLRLKIASSAVRKAGNKISKRVRTPSQRRLLNEAIRENDLSKMRMFKSSLRAVPLTSTKNVVPPITIAGDMPADASEEKALKWICENYGRVKFLGKSSASAKLTAKLYLAGFTSTRDLPTGIMDKSMAGMPPGTANEMGNEIILTGEKAVKESIKVKPVLFVKNPVQERNDAQMDLSCVGYEMKEKERERIVLSMDAVEAPKNEPKKEFKEELANDIKEGKILSVKFVNVEDGETVLIAGDPGKNFCTGLNMDGTGDPERRKPFLIYKSEADAKKGRDPSKEGGDLEKMEVSKG